LNLKQVGAFLVEDLTASWKHILGAFGLASVVSVGNKCIYNDFVDRK
jgi:hypothetical protein